MPRDMVNYEINMKIVQLIIILISVGFSNITAALKTKLNGEPNGTDHFFYQFILEIFNFTFIFFFISPSGQIIPSKSK